MIPIGWKRFALILKSASRKQQHFNPLRRKSGRPRNNRASPTAHDKQLANLPEKIGKTKKNLASFLSFALPANLLTKYSRFSTSACRMIRRLNYGSLLKNRKGLPVCDWRSF